MPLFTFYLCRPDGGATSFEIFALPNDTAAADRAVLMLEQHASCDYVEVMCDERAVCTRRRERADRPGRPGWLKGRGQAEPNSRAP